VLSAGILAGITTAWQSLLNKILNPIGFSDTTIGWLGFGNGFAGNVGTVVIGFLADRVYRRKFKSIILGLLGIEGLMMLWFTLSLPYDGSSTSLIPHSIAGLAVAIMMTGLAGSALSAPFYELCAELTYPVPEGTSAGILAFIWNAAALVMIFLSPIMNPDYINTIVTITILVCIGMVISVQETYNRPKDEPEHVNRNSESPYLNI